MKWMVMFAFLASSPAAAQDVFIYKEQITEPPKPKAEWMWRLAPFNGALVPFVCHGDQCAALPKPMYHQWMRWAMKLREA